MTNYNPESNNDSGETHDRNEVLWNEQEWQHYLLQHDAEVRRFLTLYANLRDNPERLDEIAHELGWDTVEWNEALLAEDKDEDEAAYRPSFRADEDEEEEDEDDDDGPGTPLMADGRPYTIHRHPVFVVTRALSSDLRRLFERFLDRAGAHVPPTLTWTYGQTLAEAELQAVQAVQNADLGDTLLAVVQFKKALAALNLALRCLQEVCRHKVAGAESLRRESQQRLFDLREVWLRVMRDCRDEARSDRADAAGE